MAVNNTGTINVQNGYLQLNANLISTGNLDISSTASVEQRAGSDTIQTMQIANGGSYQLTGGSLDINTISGNFVQQGGSFEAGINQHQAEITGNYSLDGGNLQEVLGGTTSGTFNQLLVDGNVNLAGGGLNISLAPGFTLQSGDYFDILSSKGAINGTFNGLSEGSVINVDGTNLTLTYHGGNGNDIALVDNVPTSTAVPEPSNLMLFGIGLTGLLRFRYRK